MPPLPPPSNTLTNGSWIGYAFPYNLSVRSAKHLSLPPPTPPAKEGSDYAYYGSNPSAATLTYTPTTGTFKGAFKLYYDAPGHHKTTRVAYAGVMLPAGGSMIGAGTGTATINKQKISIPIRISE